MKTPLVAVIPARQGSIGLPGKNTRLLGGISLVERAVTVALETGLFQSVILSTDSQAIADLGRRAGAEVPGLRPERLATDSSTVVDVALHVLDLLTTSFRRPGAIMLLQPTSPFRSVTTVKRAAELATATSSSVVSVSHVKQYPEWVKTMDNGGVLHPLANASIDGAPRQSLPKYVVPNGAIFLSDSDSLQEHRSFYGRAPRGLVLGLPEAIDIDDEEDWQLAERFADLLPGHRL